MKQLLKYLELNYDLELSELIDPYGNITSVVKEGMINKINTEGTEFNSFLIQSIKILEEIIAKLKDGATMTYFNMNTILKYRFLAKNLLLLIEHEEFKILPSELCTILINADTIFNAATTISELQKRKLKEISSEEQLITLKT